MDAQLKSIFGSWIEAIGTTVSAIASTPAKSISTELQKDLSLIGNVLQATGSGLLADSVQTINLNKIGNQIEAIGNSTIISEILLDFSEQTKQELNIKGNLLQALGGGLSFVDSLGQKPSKAQLYSIYGNLLQIIGNTLQAVAGGVSWRGGEASQLNTLGSWIQAIGAIISALAASNT
ncbi:DUF6944 family repetitive protein [Radiobacillus sp. PE A8.2]|uniref:DUF6944 family repetitive protein n=1 Tax=Radiobacillus sp. PE A8.2 TaxID=3380349 RepID=UPI00388EB3B8